MVKENEMKEYQEFPKNENKALPKKKICVTPKLSFGAFGLKWKGR